MVELAEIFRSAGEAYRQAYGDRMLPSHKRAMADIVACRTPALGGSLFVCDTCEGLDYAYHSCRNRHCPKCHHGPSQLWLSGLRDRLLPCPYYFITFTLPAELRSLARSHQKAVYDLLLREAAAALQHLADDPQWVGAKLGILAVLHTWSRDLSYHPHVHLLVTAGSLTEDGQAWRKPAHSRFLVPGYALSKIFRAKVRDALDRAGLLDQVDPAVFRKSWNVHLEHAGDGEHAAEYLSRYAHRVAITNDRIEAFEHGRITFRYICSRTHQTRRLTLPSTPSSHAFSSTPCPKAFKRSAATGSFARPPPGCENVPANCWRSILRSRRLHKARRRRTNPATKRPTSTAVTSALPVGAAIWSTCVDCTASSPVPLSPTQPGRPPREHWPPPEDLPLFFLRTEGAENPRLRHPKQAAMPITETLSSSFAASEKRPFRLSGPSYPQNQIGDGSPSALFCPSCHLKIQGTWLDRPCPD